MLEQVKSVLAEILEKELGQSHGSLLSLLSPPKQYQHGHLSLPLFSFAKERKQSPQKLGQSLLPKLEEKLSTFTKKIELVGGFLNFHLQPAHLQARLFQSLQATTLAISPNESKRGKGEKGEMRESPLGHSNLGRGKTMVIDYASPNIAKPMNIGHFRATIIGQAIKNLGETQGFKTLGVNHLGDWGTQFGKLAWAFEQWSQEYPLKEKPMESLLQLYTRFHKEAEARPELEALGAKKFQMLEQGDKQVQAIWKKLVDLSLKDYEGLWKLLGVQHDLVQGESFYNPFLPELLKRLEAKKLLKESQGAKVVFLEEGLSPCLIQKSDGASIYAARDLACAIYRREQLHAHLNLYVVGVDQELHFKQVFQVLKKMGYTWVDNCHHIAFGMYRFKDKRMSTRKGQVVLFSEVVEQAILRAKKVLEEREVKLTPKQGDEVARQVGLGALIFNDLVNDRIRNVDFDWEQVLDFRGDNGPYVQYTHVRCLSVLEKFTGKREPLESFESIDLLELTESIESSESTASTASTESSDSFKERERGEKMVILEELLEQQLIFHLLRFQETLTKSFSLYRPNILAQYLLELCHLFSQFYQKHSILKAETSQLKRARILLVGATQRVLQKGMEVLHLPIPKVM